MALLEIEDLSVTFPSRTTTGRAVDRVSIVVAEGESLGVVGESGSGKSLTMLAVMGLVPYPGQVTANRLKFKDRDLFRLSGRERRQLAGKSMAMIFQDPMTSLNPCFTVGFQLVETLRIHEKIGRKAARQRAIALLEQVGIPAAESRMRAFPHQLSGGMNQRVMIAMAIACQPDLLIADEPTTALDVTVQAQILDLLRSLQHDRGMALILVTHNMDVVADTARRVVVMYAGQIVEERDTAGLFAAPQHPYTAALLAARPPPYPPLSPTLPSPAGGEGLGRGQGKGRDGAESGRLATIPGVPPGLHDRPRGCLFGPRCAYATERSCTIQPEIRPWMGGRIRCHYPLGDPDRNARMAADGLLGAKPVP
ncbi:MAG TPA: ABC transporter ATP-binding protein [Xanthobacteraceae bacterium]|nr:ABC transporter ATP-binding protein [Xanthobacteraceae bacterium]